MKTKLNMGITLYRTKLVTSIIVSFDANNYAFI